MKKVSCMGLSDTEKLAQDLAKQLKKGDVICLDGDLGAGKTAFTGFLLKALGVQEESIPSPTFSIVNEYQTDSFTIYHFDAYRLEGSDEIFDSGFDEYIYSDAISVIEWASNVMEALPKKRWEIIITKDLEKGEDYRDFSISKDGE
jgi:ATPase, YjeE family